MSEVRWHEIAKCCWCGKPLVRTDEGPWWCVTPACNDRQKQSSSFHQEFDRRTGKPTGRILKWLYVPTPRQVQWHEAVLRRDLTRILVGGQAGPGKSRWLRETLYMFAKAVPGFHALLLRRTHKDLDQSHLRFVPFETKQRGMNWKSGERIVEFEREGEPTSIIRMGHLEDSSALQNYLSAEYDCIAPDELVTFDRDEMLELFSRARSTNPALFALRGMTYVENGRTKRLDGSLVLTATNPAAPGGRGGRWVKDFFIDKTPDPELFKKYRPSRWAFFAASLDDNPYMEEGYRDTLEDLPEVRRRQLLYGDWDVFEGQYFDFTARTHARELHIPRPLDGVIEAVDWGFTSPGCVGWFVPVGDNHWHCIHEWKFQRLPAEDVARGIVKMRKTLGIASVRYTVCDPSMKNKTGHAKGESFGETFARFGVPCRYGDNDRNMGWPRLAAWFKPAEDGIPWLTFETGTCKYLIRSIPALLSDKNDPEDVDSGMDDHGADMCRYFVMSRPPLHSTASESAKTVPANSWGAWKQYAAQALRVGGTA
jgi:phage terminase large subunit